MMNKNTPSSVLVGDIIGLDVGEKRVGVARVSTNAKIPEALEPILTSTSDVFSSVLTLIKEYDAVAIVVGLPRGLDGQETAQTKKIREFTQTLKLKTDTSVYLIDEAGTSKEAAVRLDGKNGSVDSVAATIMLEDFLNYSDKSELKA